MEILYTADEKYLQAVEELYYGELPKALHLFNQIIDSDPNYARAHFQLGCCYFYNFKNYQTAGYHLKKCIELDAGFPDSYVPYLKLLITLKMYKAVALMAEKALSVPGVTLVDLYELLGNHAEQQQDFAAAKDHYEKAVAIATTQAEYASFQEHAKRITAKVQSQAKMIYVIND